MKKITLRAITIAALALVPVTACGGDDDADVGDQDAADGPTETGAPTSDAPSSGDEPDAPASGDEPAMTSGALLVLMTALERATNPRALASAAKHVAFTRCGELNFCEMVDAQVPVLESKLLRL